MDDLFLLEHDGRSQGARRKPADAGSPPKGTGGCARGAHLRALSQRYRTHSLRHAIAGPCRRMSEIRRAQTGPSDFEDDAQIIPVERHAPSSRLAAHMPPRLESVMCTRSANFASKTDGFLGLPAAVIRQALPSSSGLACNGGPAEVLRDPPACRSCTALSINCGS